VFTGNTGQNGASNSVLQASRPRFTLWDVHTQYRPLGRLDLQARICGGHARRRGQRDRRRYWLQPPTPADAFAAPRHSRGVRQAAYHATSKAVSDVAPSSVTSASDIKQQEDPPRLLQVRTIIETHQDLPESIIWSIPSVVLKADNPAVTHDTTNPKTRFSLRLGMDPEIDSEVLDAFDIGSDPAQAVGGVFLLLDIDAL